MRFKLLTTTKFFFILLFSLNRLVSQINLNDFTLKKIYRDYNLKYDTISKTDSNKIIIYFNQSAYINDNLPNFENRNGLYTEKGFGVISSFLYLYKAGNLTLSFEPKFLSSQSFELELPRKLNTFSVLNDVPLNDDYKVLNNNIDNAGIIFDRNGFSFGYGNWNYWWGPGIHNSLVMTNNAKGFYRYFFEYYAKNNKRFNYSLKYHVSNKMVNNLGIDFYLTSLEFKILYQNLELGISKNILSGGNMNVRWAFEDALKVIITKDNIKYWDQINDIYFLYSNKKIGLKAFAEIGQPNTGYGYKNPNNYPYHSRGSIIGLRKIGLFKNENLLFGFEYTRLVQGYYYNIIATPNWYDNIKYNYNSYLGRRWTAHSGSDSDDMLIYFGMINHKNSLIYGINYERHGVTYTFPPEVKLESRISFSHIYKNILINILLENEYYEHYGFVDSNINVWEQSYENGSIQRTNSLLFSLEYKLF